MGKQLIFNSGTHLHYYSSMQHLHLAMKRSMEGGRDRCFMQMAWLAVEIGTGYVVKNRHDGKTGIFDYEYAIPEFEMPKKVEVIYS